MEWYSEEKDALTGAIYRWIEDDGMAVVPEVVAFDLRYALYGDWQDEVRGMYLFQLNRDGTVQEVPVERQRAVAVGQQVEVNGETWVVTAAAPLLAGPYVASVRAEWHPG